MVVEIADDGRGVDWEAVRARAAAAGLPARTSADLHAALFHDGLSTRADADDLSGRGVGMGALREECERLRGKLMLSSARGVGTTLTFSLPVDVVCESEETRRAGRALSRDVVFLPSLRPSSSPPA